MTDDEYSILSFMNGSPDSWYARREIARRAVKRAVFEENPHWLDAALSALVERGEVEMKDGLYHLKPGE